MTFYDVTKQSGHANVGTLYREVLDKIVFPFIHSKKGEGEAYSLFVSEIKIFSLLSLSEYVLHHHSTCTCTKSILSTGICSVRVIELGLYINQWVH